MLLDSAFDCGGLLCPHAHRDEQPYKRDNETIIPVHDALRISPRSERARPRITCSVVHTKHEECSYDQQKETHAGGVVMEQQSYHAQDHDHVGMRVVMVVDTSNSISSSCWFTHEGQVIVISSALL